MLLRLIEQVANAARAHADKHLHKIRTGDGHERHARLARDGLGQQRFARAGRADEQHALGNPRADRRKPARVLEELDQLLHLFLLFHRAGNVRKGDAVAVRLEHARRAVAEGHHFAAATALLAHHHQPERHQTDGHNDIRQHIQQPRRRGLRQIDQVKPEVNLRDVLQRLARFSGGKLAAGLHKRILRNDGAEIIRRIGKRGKRNGARLHVRVGRAAFQRDGVDHTAVDIFKQLGRLDFLPALAAERRGEKLRRNQHAGDNQRVNDFFNGNLQLTRPAPRRKRIIHRFPGAARRCPAGCDTFPRNRGRNRQRIHPES